MPKRFEKADFRILNFPFYPIDHQIDHFDLLTPNKRLLIIGCLVAAKWVGLGESFFDSQGIGNRLFLGMTSFEFFKAICCRGFMEHQRIVLWIHVDQQRNRRNWMPKQRGQKRLLFSLLFYTIVWTIVWSMVHSSPLKIFRTPRETDMEISKYLYNWKQTHGIGMAVDIGIRSAVQDRQYKIGIRSSWVTATCWEHFAKEEAEKSNEV